MAATQVFVKGSQQAHVKDGAIVGYVGAAVTLEELTISNGWLLQGESNPVYEAPPPIGDGFAQNRYNALIAAGLSAVDASAVTGYTP